MGWQLQPPGLIVRRLRSSSCNHCLLRAKMRASRRPGYRFHTGMSRSEQPRQNSKRMSTVFPTGPKMDPEAQVLWHEVASASDEIASIVDRIPGLTVTGIETRNELERAAVLLKAVADILRRTERREAARYAPVNRSILGPDPVP